MNIVYHFFLQVFNVDQVDLSNSEYIHKPVLLFPLVVEGDDNDLVVMATTIGAEINGHSCRASTRIKSTGVEQQLNELKFVSEGSYGTGDPGQFDALTSQLEHNWLMHPSANPTLAFQVFSGGDGSGDDWSNSDSLYWRPGYIKHYRRVGPVIENDYHLSLCDYALYIAMVKENPDLSMKHQQLWEKTIIDTINDNIDKELPTGMKEEI